MTFLKWYGLGAVGFTMLITAIGLQWYLFCDSFWHQMYNTENHPDWTRVPVNMYSLMDALFGVSAVLITFGGLIGKVSPFQLVVLTFIELCCHACNFRVFLQGIMRISDCGGTYIDHMFGAYFGLAVAYVLGSPKSQPQLGTVPDVFSLIGTLFLWVYWPSFVAGTTAEGSVQQQTALVNTVLALSASTISTFWLSSLIAKNGRYRPVDIQNATLAGGVAIGAAANMNLNSFSAIMIGIAAGLVSCFGFNYIQPWLEENIGLHDTCGIHNLHAMPSVVGAIASVIVSGYQQSGDRNHSAEVFGQYKNQQWWRQWVSILFCIGFAVSSGLITGFILKSIGGTEEEKSQLKEYHDQPYWEVADDYNHSLYTELAKVIKASSKKQGVSLLNTNELDKEVSDWSSHGGRRNLKVVQAEKHQVSANIDTASLHEVRKPIVSVQQTTQVQAAVAVTETDKSQV
jgi:ammonium transporter Rh